MMQLDLQAPTLVQPPWANPEPGPPTCTTLRQPTMHSVLRSPFPTVFAFMLHNFSFTVHYTKKAALRSIESGHCQCQK